MHVQTDSGGGVRALGARSIGIPTEPAFLGDRLFGEGSGDALGGAVLSCAGASPSRGESCTRPTSSSAPSLARARRLFQRAAHAACQAASPRLGRRTELGDSRGARGRPALQLAVGGPGTVHPALHLAGKPGRRRALLRAEAPQHARALPVTLRVQERFCALVAANKRSSHRAELYSERRRAIRWFERHHPEQFDLYGVGWNRPLLGGPRRVQALDPSPRRPGSAASFRRRAFRRIAARFRPSARS